MESDNATLKFVLAILAIGTATGPIIFGFALWRMAQVFVTKEQFLEFKTQSHQEREELKRKVEHIDSCMVILLQRTAHLNGSYNKE